MQIGRGVTAPFCVVMGPHNPLGKVVANWTNLPISFFETVAHFVLSIAEASAAAGVGPVP